MLFDNVNEVIINNEKVKSIKTLNNGTIYEKEDALMLGTLILNIIPDDSMMTYAIHLGVLNDFVTENSKIYWGEGAKGDSITNVIINEGEYGSEYAKSYYDGNMKEVKITNVTSNYYYGVEVIYGDVYSIILPSNLKTIPERAFASYTTLESINIPSSVIEIGKGTFSECTNLSRIDFNWESNLVTYNSTWIKKFMMEEIGVNPNIKFYIPFGTTQTYINAGYPSDKLVERGE